MNPIKIQEWVASSLRSLKLESPKIVHMCVFEGKIQIQKVTHTLKPHPLLYVFTEQQINKGLSDDEWSTVLRIILKHERRFTICQDHRS